MPKQKTVLVDVRDLITQTVAARLRGVSRTAIHDLVRRGRLNSIKICGVTFVFRSEVLAFSTGSREQVRKMSNNEVLEDVLCVARSICHLPSSFEYKQHGRIHLSTVCKRFGGWPKVAQAARKRLKT